MAFVKLTPQVLRTILAPLEQNKNPAICLAKLNKERPKIQQKKVDGLDRTYAQFVAGFAAATAFVQHRLQSSAHPLPFTSGTRIATYAWLKGFKHATATCR